jgi:hypothetical protein
MSNSNLTDEEKEILEAYEQNEMCSVLTPEMRKAHIAAARQTFKKDRRASRLCQQLGFVRQR